MPCGDITEVLDLRLDARGRLITYSLAKRTCGAEIGRRDLLIDWLAGRDAEDILGLDGGALRAAHTIAADEEFLYAKHLVAVQAALAVLRGDAPGGPIDPCALISVAYDDGWQLRAAIAVAALTEQIKACGSCGTCGRVKQAPKAATC